MKTTRKEITDEAYTNIERSLTKLDEYRQNETTGITETGFILGYIELQKIIGELQKLSPTKIRRQVIEAMEKMADLKSYSYGLDRDSHKI